MAKSRKDNIDSFSGMFQGTELYDQNQQNIQENFEIIEDEKYIPTKEINDKKSLNKKKKEKEKLTRYSFFLNESIMNDLEKVARMKKKRYVVELIRELLEEEVNKNQDLIDKYNNL